MDPIIVTLSIFLAFCLAIGFNARGAQRQHVAVRVVVPLRRGRRRFLR
jgi:hypothetical protein